jgi:hypothetical protein
MDTTYDTTTQVMDDDNLRLFESIPGMLKDLSDLPALNSASYALCVSERTMKVILKHATRADVPLLQRPALRKILLDAAADNIFPQKPAYTLAAGKEVYIPADPTTTTVKEFKIKIAVKMEAALGCSVAPARARLVRTGKTSAESEVLDMRRFDGKTLLQCGVCVNTPLQLQVCSTMGCNSVSSPTTMKPGNTHQPYRLRAPTCEACIKCNKTHVAFSFDAPGWSKCTRAVPCTKCLRWMVDIVAETQRAHPCIFPGCATTATAGTRYCDGCVDKPAPVAEQGWWDGTMMALAETERVKQAKRGVKLAAIVKLEAEPEPEPKPANKRKLSEVDALRSMVNNLLEANDVLTAENKKLRAQMAVIDGKVKQEPGAKVEASAPPRRRSTRVRVATRRA